MLRAHKAPYRQSLDLNPGLVTPGPVLEDRASLSVFLATWRTLRGPP